MNKAMVLRVVNATLFFSFIAQVITSLLIFFRIKTPNTPLVFEIHEYSGLFMITLALTHITLNWGWIKANFFKKRVVSK